MLHLILLIAAVQGLFLSLQLFHRIKRVYANVYLGGMIGLFSIMLFYLYLGDEGILDTHPGMMTLLMGVAFLLPPLHFLYTKHLLFPGKHFQHKEWFHAFPFFVFEGIHVLLFLFRPEWIPTRLERMAHGTLSWPDRLYNGAILIQVTVYLNLSLRCFRIYSDQLKERYSNLDRVKLSWLRNMTLLIGGLVIVFFIENLFFIFGINLSHYFTLTSVLAGVYVYAIGYLGLLKAEVWLGGEIRPVFSSEKYKKSGLTSAQARAICEKLINFMKTQCLYRDSELTLDKLAFMLSVSPHHLSEAIHTVLGENFYELVNRYRLEEVKQGLADPSKDHLTVLSIAFDAGFNSKSTFNTLFKKHTGMTPSEYREKKRGNE